MRPQNVTFTMPPGDYVIGDPAYTISKDLKDECRRNLRYEQPFLLQGSQCLVFSTAYGDGTYPDQDGFEYPVDSGAIGMIPARLTEVDEHTRELVKHVSFDQRMECSADYRRNILKFGHITINLG